MRRAISRTNWLIGLIYLSILALVVTPAGADDAPPSLPRSTPEAQGVPSEAVEDFIKAADAKVRTMHSFMLVRHGHVVAEAWWKPQTPDTPHVLWSLSKSFTSTAMGLLVHEGKVGLDDEVVKFFPDDVPANPSANLKAMRVRDLLSMSTGHETEPPVREQADMSWVRTFFHHPVPHKPGTHFKYNTPATYMVSAIVQKVTGQTVLQYLKPRLFEPLGIKDPEWGASPQGITLGGYGLFLRTEDIAKFGQLYLQKGRWNGRQLIPAEWVAAATSKQVSNGSNPNSDWDQGYGFQFWRCRHNAFRGDGKDGQFCVVLPEQDAVVAMTAETRDLQGQLALVWDKLLPAFKSEPLPENAEAQARLKRTVENLVATPPDGVGKVLENRTTESKILRKEVKYSIYLPSGYDASEARYPVLYLLHGNGDDCASWIRKGNLPGIADAAIKAGKSAPFIVVMPDAERTYYLNNVRGEYNYEDFFLEELMPHVEATYRCKPGQGNRAVAGLSMGGFGSLLYCLHHPDLFGHCGAMSAGIRTDDEARAMPLNEFNRRYETAFGPFKEGDERITEHWKRNSILHLAAALPAGTKPATRYFIDCGDDDFLDRGNTQLHLLLLERKIPHEYRVRNGGHNWQYWQTSLPDVLSFITQGLPKE